MKRASMLLAVIAQLLVLQHAQAYPDRPIKLVVPSPAGSPPDQMARLVSDKMSANLGQPVIVDNRAGGAGGTVGAKSVVTAEPDGHTILLCSTSNLLIAPLIYKDVGYNAGTFVPVARIGDTMEMFAVHPVVPARSVAELVSLAKSRPGVLNFGSAGVGTLPHLEGELLKARAQIDISHIPYRGGNQALTGLLGGEIQILFSTLTQVLPHVRDGRLRALAGSQNGSRASDWTRTSLPRTRSAARPGLTRHTLVLGLAHIRSALRSVSRRYRRASILRVCAITGREQMQQRHAPMRCYSISSSARAISLSEMVSPSALAVVRVMTRGLIVHFFNHAAPGGSAQADRNSADRVPAWMSPKYCIHAAFCSRVIGMPLRSSLFELYSCAMIRTGQRIESDSPSAMKEGPSTIDGATRSTSR
jgi:tripartite-type tricarboxylate transporter receptor subunit TctC